MSDTAAPPEIALAEQQLTEPQHIQQHRTGVPTNSPMEDQTTTQSNPNFFQRLSAGERLWMWKVALRGILITTGVIGVGCIAWAFSTAADGPYVYDLDDKYSIVWALITFAISIVWCAICILVLLLRRPNAPVHPGVAVGIDLILWLAFVFTALFCIVGVISVMSWGSNGEIGEYSAYGYYYQVSNGTWVWNATDYDTYFNKPRDCCPNSNSYPNPDYTYCFSSCTQEDQYINDLWKARGRRIAIEMTGTVCQFIGLVLHFALFVWACVDTHYRNRRKTTKEAEQLAGDIVMSMVRSGALVRAPGQGYNAIPEHGGTPQQFQQHPNWYQPQPQWQQGEPSAQDGAPVREMRASEKGASTRFA